MSIEGSWDLTVVSAAGVQKGKLEIVRDGAALKGKLLSPTGNAEFTEGSLDGNAFELRGKLSKGLRLSVTLSGSVDGAQIKANLTLARMGSVAVTAERSAT
jgi:hypothetical protein